MASNTNLRKQEPGPMIGFALVSLVVALPAFVISLAVRAWAKADPTQKRWSLLVLVGLAGAGAMYYFWRLPLVQLGRDVQHVIQVKAWPQLPPLIMTSWKLTLPAAPLMAYVLHVLIPKTIEEQYAEQRRQQQRSALARSKKAATVAKKALLQMKGEPVLGRPVDRDPELKEFVRKGWAIFPAAILRRGLCIIGFPGSGKTETLLRLAASVAKVLGWQVIFLDCKGDPETARRFYAAMRAAGLSKVNVFPHLTYDGWRGDAGALKDRLKAVLSFSEPYYESITDAILHLALNAPQGLPRSSEELVERLRLEVLEQLYEGHPKEQRAIRSIPEKDALGVYNRYQAFFTKVGHQLDGAWAFENCDAAYFLIDGVSLQDQAISLGRYLLQDFNHYAARRKEQGRQVLLIVDEYSAIEEGTKIHDLIERLRGYGAATVVGSQSYGGLGKYADRILDATPTKIVHQCDDPERLTNRAGELKRMGIGLNEQERRGGSVDARIARGRGVSYQEEREARVDPDVVRQLEPGEAFVISGGKAMKVRMTRVTVTTDQLEQARVELERVVDSAALRRRAATLAFPVTTMVAAHEPATDDADDNQPDPDDDYQSV